MWRLYEWNEALVACPSGWHLPLKDEWDELVNFIVREQNLNAENDEYDANGHKYDPTEKVGTYLKTSSGWEVYDGVPADKDAYGFSVLPAGRRFCCAEFREMI